MPPHLPVSVTLPLGLMRAGSVSVASRVCVSGTPRIKREARILFAPTLRGASAATSTMRAARRADVMLVSRSAETRCVFLMSREFIPCSS